MDHGHGGHNMPMGPTCNMNMLWNTDVVDTCIGWHIGSKSAFTGACIAIIALCVLYEYMRTISKAYDARIAAYLVSNQNKLGRPRSRSNGSESAAETAGLLTGKQLFRSANVGLPVPFTSRAMRAVLYGANIFLSFFLMLVFMTYNIYLIVSVVVGAALGNYIFGATMNVDSMRDGDKGMACH